MGTALSIQNLKVYFYVRKGIFRTVTVKAVDGVSLTVEQGQTIAVVGESGSGKTTLGRATLRLVQLVQGSIFFDGQDINKFSDAELKRFRQRAQPIFQDPYSSINPYMTAYQLVEEPLLIHGVKSRNSRKEQVLQALEKVKLVPPTEFASKYPHTLSGGQRQRVSIARSLVLRPQYIVADEPVSMIDASSR
ncbi:ABC transporter ATP-binding protein, partial [Candidatus Aerophobetes bacterium]|nr:ABC transporter ATP-binding protein [Candidatus Aerophobetes bacterium]